MRAYYLGLRMLPAFPNGLLGLVTAYAGLLYTHGVGTYLGFRMSSVAKFRSCRCVLRIDSVSQSVPLNSLLTACLFLPVAQESQVESVTSYVPTMMMLALVLYVVDFYVESISANRYVT